MWWLPEETESVVVSRGNPPVAEYKPAETKPPPGYSGAYLPWPGGYVRPTDNQYQDLVAEQCIEPLVNRPPIFIDPQPERLIQSLYGPKTAKLFGKAMRRNKAGGREMCDIVIFGDKTADRIIDSLTAFAQISRKIADVRVLEMDLNRYAAPHDQRADSFRMVPLPPDRKWLAAPRSDVYVASTSSEFLNVIIERIKQRGARRALPPDLPEWRQLDLAAPAWGIRHYRPPTGKDSLSMASRDPSAVGLVFFGANKPAPVLTLRYLSTSGDAPSRLLRMQTESLGMFPMREEHRNSLPDIARVSQDCVESRTRIYVPPAEIVGKPLRNLDRGATEGFCMQMMFFRWLGFSCPSLMAGYGYKELDQ